MTLMMSGMVLDRAGANRSMRTRAQADAATRQRGLAAASLRMRSMAASTSVHFPVRECETHDMSCENAAIGASGAGEGMSAGRGI